MSGKDHIEYIEHDGMVVSINVPSRLVEVEIEENPGCKGCAAASLCSPDGKERQKIIVEVKNPSLYAVGEKVILRGSEMLHRKAIMIATVVPSIALIAAMVIIYIMTANQLAAALGGIGVMLFFFVGLWLMRHHIAHEFNFEIVLPKTS